MASTAIVPPPAPRVSLTASLVRIAASCMAEHDIRYYLNGIRVEPRPEGGALIIATDGHRLCAVIDVEGECSAPVTLALDRKLLAPTRKRRGDVVLGEDRLELVSMDKDLLLVRRGRDGKLADRMKMVAPTRIIEGQFPDWRRVLPPDFGALKRQCLNAYRPQYVLDTLRAIGPSSLYRMPAATPYQAEADLVIAFHIEMYPQVLLLVMPMRDVGANSFTGFGRNFWPEKAPAPKVEAKTKPKAKAKREAATA